MNNMKIHAKSHKLIITGLIIAIGCVSAGIWWLLQTKTTPQAPKTAPPPVAAPQEPKPPKPPTLQEEFAYIKTDLTAKGQTSMFYLLNKKNSLSADYKPAGLIIPKIPYNFGGSPEKKYVRPEMASALEQMFQAAQAEQNLKLYGLSGYRSYATQKSLFAYYARQDGEANAEKYSARAGTSEHQTGLAMDITSASAGFDLSVAFAKTKEGQWVKHNAHRFGLIVRYLEGKEHLTTYQYEPWHLRLLDQKTATYLYEKNLTLEEFYDQIGVDYNR